MNSQKPPDPITPDEASDIMCVAVDAVDDAGWFVDALATNTGDVVTVELRVERKAQPMTSHTLKFGARTYSRDLGHWTWSNALGLSGRANREEAEMLDRIAQTEGALRHIADYCKPVGIAGNHVRMGAKKARQIAKEALDG